MSTTLDARLADLQEHYTYRVNMLLEENREDLATELADQYLDEAAHTLGSAAN